MNADRHPITSKPVLYHVEGAESIAVHRDIQYGEHAAIPLTLDLYEPALSSESAPIVVLVTGYPDVGVPQRLGCAFKDMAMWTSLGRILAACGIAAVGYTSARPPEDIDMLLEYLAEHAQSLGIDAHRVGLWATSGHVPTALGALARHTSRRIQAAVLSTGFTLDLAGSAVVNAAATYGFALPAVTIDDVPADVPLFVARAGRDENGGLNETLDRFIAAALARNWPLTVLNHANARHAFELNDRTEITNYAIQAMIDFTRFWLGVRGTARSEY